MVMSENVLVLRKYTLKSLGDKGEARECVGGLGSRHNWRLDARLLSQEQAPGWKYCHALRTG